MTEGHARPAAVFDPAATPPSLAGAVVAIGNFDGVHRGHQEVLREALSIAGRARRPAVALTFEPHPRTVFRPDAPVFRITPLPEKAAVMGAFGIDGLAVSRFDAAFAAQSAEDFIARVLVEGLHAAHVVVGHDFRFGAKRVGTAALLAEEGARHGFRVSEVDAFTDADGETISSTRVRAALRAGDVPGAARLLGYHPIAVAEVIHGEKRGRTMNYPTANQRLGADNRLAHGIYAVRALVDGVAREGVASFGRRPTFDNGAPLLETFLFDFSGDLYGKTMQVTLIAFLRLEERFSSMEALIEQMDRDSENARAALAAARPVSPLDARLGFSG